MTPAHAALLAAGWTLADAPELAGAHWRHPERGPFVWPEDRALALILGQPGVAYGFCHCGCGERTRIASRTRPRDGWTKGEPVKYIMGHAAREGQVTKHNRNRAYRALQTTDALAAKYRIHDNPGDGRCVVCGEPVPSAAPTARYCGAACNSYAAEQRRRAAQPTRAEMRQ